MNEALLLLERFPRAALALLPFAGKKRGGKRGRFTGEIKEGVEVFCLLGAGVAFEAAEKWLKGSPKRRLCLIETSPSALFSLLEEEELINHPQVEISFLPKGEGREEELWRLAHLFASSVIDIEAMPPFALLSQQLWEKYSVARSLFFERWQGGRIFANLLENAQQLKRSFCFNELQGAFEGHAAIIVGAGPSLTDDLSHIRRLQDKALIIAGGSAIPLLAKAGIDPHFSIAIDPNPEEERRLTGAVPARTNWLYSLRLYRGCFAHMKGSLGYLRAAIGGFFEVYLEEALKIHTYPLVGEKLPLEAMSVTSVSAAAAIFLGAKTLFLSGVDLAYTDGKRYATGFAVDEEKKDLLYYPGDRPVADQKVDSAIRWTIEAKALATFFAHYPEVKVFNSSKGLPIRGTRKKKLARVNLPNAGDLWQKIASSPIDASPLDCALEELLSSLQELKELIETIHEKRPGSHLAEITWQETLAAKVLFPDFSWKVLSQVDDPWGSFLRLIETYSQRACCEGS